MHLYFSMWDLGNHSGVGGCRLEDVGIYLVFGVGIEGVGGVGRVD